MMNTRPLNLARRGLVAVAVLLVASGCTVAEPTWTPPAGSPAPSVATVAASPSPGAPAGSPVASAAPSVAPAASAASSAVPASPAAPTPRATITGNVVIPTPRAPGASVDATGATPGPAASEPATAQASVRPGPTPIVGEIRPAPDFVDLVKPDGTPFSLAEDKGSWTIVFFGYTHCPDVCPATIGELISVEQVRPDVKVVFVTVDPERDTPEFLGEWTKYLPKGLTAITGSPLAIRHAADTWGVRYARVDTGSKAGYSMSHTAFQYLIDPDGNLVLTYPFGTPAAAILGDLDQLERAG